MKNLILPFLAVAALLGLAACGGGGGITGVGTGTTGTTPAKGTLVYTNPTGYQGQPYQFALVWDAASTATSLVLDLVGPSATPAVGVTFAFDVDATKATWAASPALVNNGSLFTLGAGTQLAQGWVAGTGGYRLQGIVAQKGLANPIADVGAGVIGTITLTPVSGATTGTVTLKESLDSTGNVFGTLMDGYGPPATPVHFAVGTLQLQ